MPEAFDARPTKRFFIDNLTRDLSLEDAILDLVDNSIDSLIRTRSLDVSFKTLLAPRTSNAKDELVKLTLNKNHFLVEDKCGGIDIEHAKHQVFRLGRPDGAYAGSLGVYGIGLKRALFKIGRNIEVTSRTTTSGFKVSIDVPAWAADDDAWTFPFETVPPVSRPQDAGTTINISGLNPDVLLRLEDGTLLTRLTSSLATTYALFLERYLAIAVNQHRIQPEPLPLAASGLLQPNAKHLEFDGVSVDLVAGLASRHGDEWSTDRAGWYVLCNGRVVVQADRSDLTGWGVAGPQFVPKHRGFLGIAFFFSAEPARLPWTTTKRGLNRDSAIYQFTRKEMAALGRPVLDFLNKMYIGGEPAENNVARELVKALKPVDLQAVISRARQDFGNAVTLKTAGSRNVRIQFDAAKADVERIKKKLGKPTLGAGAVGRYVFENFLRTECPE